MTPHLFEPSEYLTFFAGLTGLQAENPHNLLIKKLNN